MGSIGAVFFLRHPTGIFRNSKNFFYNNKAVKSMFYQEMAYGGIMAWNCFPTSIIILEDNIYSTNSAELG